MNLFQAIILAIIEGITEFLPISSTGHMIIASSFMGISNDDFTKLFTVCIQLGAILSVVVLYWKKFFNFRDIHFYIKLIVAFIPAAIFGVLLKDVIDEMLGSVTIVAVSMLAGGVFLLFVDKLFNSSTGNDEKPMSYFMAFKIGLFQVVSMIPGVSRSAATIVGGMSQKLSRRQAAEFSFFLAVPTMFAATIFKLKDSYQSITKENLTLLAVGNIVAFIVAMIAIKSFINFLTKHGFALFGWYRIFVGGIILLLLAMHVQLNMI